MTHGLEVIAGGVLLYLGAEWFVSGATRLALALRVPQLLVGLTVVAYGTSAPEIVVGVQAALDGHGAVAVGNVLGSNIANIGLILGLAMWLQPVVPNAALRARECPCLRRAWRLSRWCWPMAQWVGWKALGWSWPRWRTPAGWCVRRAGRRDRLGQTSRWPVPRRRQRAGAPSKVRGALVRWRRSDSRCCCSAATGSSAGSVRPWWWRTLGTWSGLGWERDRAARLPARRGLPKLRPPLQSPRPGRARAH
ncbi:MAG: sodium:calcium antiporter [Deltaproteobacteria bacterium]|nr:sodium:calcium antiporter [Deltaproteobacteria bacterium]